MKKLIILALTITTLCRASDQNQPAPVNRSELLRKLSMFHFILQAHTIAYSFRPHDVRDVLFSIDRCYEQYENENIKSYLDQKLSELEQARNEISHRLPSGDFHELDTKAKEMVNNNTKYSSK